MKLMSVLKEVNELSDAQLGSRSSLHRPRLKMWLRDFIKTYKMIVPSAKQMHSQDILRSIGKDKILRMYRRGVEPDRAVKTFITKLRT